MLFVSSKKDYTNNPLNLPPSLIDSPSNLDTREELLEQWELGKKVSYMASTFFEFGFGSSPILEPVKLLSESIYHLFETDDLANMANHTIELTKSLNNLRKKVTRKEASKAMHSFSEILEIIEKKVASIFLELAASLLEIKSLITKYQEKRLKSHISSHHSKMAHLYFNKLFVKALKILTGIALTGLYATALFTRPIAVKVAIVAFLATRLLAEVGVEFFDHKIHKATSPELYKYKPLKAPSKLLIA